MNNQQMERLFSYAPEQVQLAWAKSGFKPENPSWAHTVGPSLEVGKALFKGANVGQARDMIPRVTNPEVLLHLARTDKRITVARDLLESEHFPAEGVAVLLERFGEIDMIELDFEFDYATACANGMDNLIKAAWKSVKQRGYIGAIDQVLELIKEASGDQDDVRRLARIRTLVELMSSSHLLVSGKVTPEEYVTGFEHFLSRSGECAGITGFRPEGCLPNANTARDLVEKNPEGLERIIRALAALDAGTAATILEQCDTMFYGDWSWARFSGPVPDLSHLLAVEADTMCTNLALEIRRIWSWTVPITAQELEEKWSEVDISYRKVCMTAEAAIPLYQETDSGAGHSLLNIEIHKPFEAIDQRLLEIESLAGGTSAEQPFLEKAIGEVQTLTRWVSGTYGDALRNHGADGYVATVHGVLKAGTGLAVPEAYALLQAAETLIDGATSDMRLGRYHVSLRNQLYLKAIFDPQPRSPYRVDALARVGVSRTGHFDAVVQVVDRLINGTDSNQIWMEVLTGIPEMEQSAVLHQAPNKLVTVLKESPQLIDMLTGDVLFSAINACSSPDRSGNTGVAAELLDVLSAAGLTAKGFSSLTKLYALVPAAGASTVDVQLLPAYVAAGELEACLGDNPTNWQLALELLDDWDGTFETFADTLTALTE